MTASDAAVQAGRESRIAHAAFERSSDDVVVCICGAPVAGLGDWVAHSIRAVADAVVQTEQARLKAEALYELVTWAEANPEVRTHDVGDCLTVSLGVIRDRAYWVLAGSQSTDQDPS